MYCSKCGNAIEEGDLFCKKCGQPIKKEGIAQSTYGQRKSIDISKKKMPTGIWIVIGLIVLLVAGGIGGGLFFLVNHKVETVTLGEEMEIENTQDEEAIESVETQSPKVIQGMPQSEAEFKASCSYYSYEEIARNPKDYVGNPIYLYGQVLQVMEQGDEVQLRVNITEAEYGWQDAVYVSYTRKSSNESRILEEDMITVWGISNDTISYETVLGQSLTVPYIEAAYIELTSMGPDGEPADYMVNEPSESYYYNNYDDGGNAYNDGYYVIPYSDSYYLTEADLMYLSKEELTIARNEIYARHGRMFKNDDLQAYFNVQWWYIPEVPADEFTEALLSEIEIYNANFIKNYEDQLG